MTSSAQSSAVRLSRQLTRRQPQQYLSVKDFLDRSLSITADGF
ncbi:MULTISPECIES: hypothetical protein [unclassified Roseofilum]|nr:MULTISPECIES: hypothetical protein [unclassified Roseofilum]